MKRVVVIFLITAIFLSTAVLGFSTVTLVRQYSKALQVTSTKLSSNKTPSSFFLGNMANVEINRDNIS